MNKIPLNTLIVSDAIEGLKLLPEDSVDLTVTSPPYNKKKRQNRGWLVNSDLYSDFDDHLDEPDYQGRQIAVLEELYRVTKPGGSLFYNHKLRWDDGELIHPLKWLSKSTWTVKQEIIWDRQIAANMRGWRFWQVDERIYWLYKPINNYLIGEELKSCHAKLSSIWRIKPEPRKDHHPAPFPIEIPSRIIYSLLDSKQGLVLDPFCGTSTTLVAAKLLGHNYLGYDISASYIDLAKQRIRNSDNEKKRVEDEVNKHFVRAPFKERKEKGKTKWPFGPKPSENGHNKLEKDSIELPENDKKAIAAPIVKSTPVVD
jgi:site-specific DNA-methyltransferase (adenine-specific)